MTHYLSGRIDRHDNLRTRDLKAFTYHNYGSPDVLRLSEVAKPVPATDEILVEVHATTVTSGDCRVRSLNVPAGFGLIMRLVFGITKPRQAILGSELAGVVESVGGNVTRFKAGDRIFAFSDVAMGCYVEYKCMRESALIAHIPANLSFDEAAALSFGGTTALHFLRKANIKRGETILINGASGSVGTAAIQLACHFGAEVTAVCSTANLELVASLGAHHVIDYTREDFFKNGRTYDIIMDAVGTAPYRRSKGSLAPGGRLLMVLANLSEMLAAPWISLTGSRKLIAGPATAGAEQIQFLAALAEAGEFTPVIDRRYPFDELPEAHRYVDKGRKRGNVVVSLED